MVHLNFAKSLSNVAAICNNYTIMRVMSLQIISQLVGASFPNQMQLLCLLQVAMHLSFWRRGRLCRLSMTCRSTCFNQGD